MTIRCQKIQVRLESNIKYKGCAVKNKIFIAFIIILQASHIAAMDSRCDHKALKSTAIRYALCIENSEQISAKGITRDLQFLSPEAIKDINFAKYIQMDSFEAIAIQAISEPQQQAVKIFTEAFESVKNDDLLTAQLCILLDRVLINLRPSIPSNIYTHPMLKSFTQSPSFKLQKMLLPSLVGEAWNS
jgi:hypothetical protein